MKTFVRLMALGFAFIAPQLCTAQAPAGAPAGSTALCTDGTYSKSTSKMTACVGHKGIKTWYGAATTSAGKTTATSTTAMKPSATTPPAKTTTTPMPATTPAPTTSSSSNTPPKPATPTTTPTKPASGGSTTAAAPGGGPNMVWENTGSSTKTYHCPSTTYYGKTKTGKYVSEAQAKTDGYHPNGGKPCFK